MYEYIRGTLQSVKEDFIVIEVGNIGYIVHFPQRIQERLPAMGEELFLYLVFIVKEQEQSFYGFLQEEERSVFQLLRQVAGIGPKVALSFLNHFSLEELREVFLQKQTHSLTKVPGIGKKGANRIFLDIGEKMEKFLDSLPALQKGRKSSSSERSSEQNGMIREAITAMIHLGYSLPHAESAVHAAAASLKAPFRLTDLIRESLQKVSR